jgi:hypothetical protein
MTLGEGISGCVPGVRCCYCKGYSSGSVKHLSIVRDVGVVGGQ